MHQGLRQFLAPVALLLATATSVLPAQVPPGPPMPQDTEQLDATPAPGSPADVRWRAAKDALQAGNNGDAVRHLLAALEFHPASPALLLDFVRATADAPEARALWVERCVRAAADAQGKVKFDAAMRKVFAADETKAAQNLALLRAQAVDELQKFAGKLKSSGKGIAANALVARWCSELALPLMQNAPALLRSDGPPFARTEAHFAPDYELVLQGLAKIMHAAPAAPPNGASDEAQARWREALQRALRAARILAGLGRQAGFKDLKGPAPPALGELPEKAAQAIEQLRGMAMPTGRLWTIAELEALSKEQRDAFTLAHRDWIDPGVSESPTRKYRIETVCGFETLLGAARTVELHHARLVAHCGADPFADRQGTVRIVPEHSDLESDGAPFWWVGGFQSGDRTTIRFAWGDLPGMGRLLTHELTHRFDGVLHAFLPAWYMEGHASWTAAHYGKAAEADCTEDLLDSGTCAHTFYKGYGDFGNFKKLVAGEVAEYRDNYFAGYSLYAFLRGWPPKEPPRYREALRHFEQNGRAGSKEPLRFFSSCFCDGKPGHAATLEEFHAQWAAFLRGCYEYQDERSHNDSNAWVGKYGRRGDGDHGGLLFDEPTWSWARARAEPWFGQGQAGLAAELLRAAGDVDAAAAAALWSLQVDGWRQQNAMALVELLTQRNQQVAAFAAAALLRQRFPTALPGPGAPAPMLAQLPRTRSYVDALAAAAADRDSVAAAALRSEHDLLAARLGLPAARAPAAAAAATPPDVPRLLSGLGYAEDGLTGFEDRRQQGLWFSTPDGDLHVGREKPRDATGLRDRAAHQRDAFVRTVDWMAAGAYVLKARIHFTTAFVSGAVLIGHWRRDRDVRLHFSAGDYDYATGRNDKDIGFRSVNLSLEAMWERDNQHMPDSTPARQFDFDGEASWLDLELRVQGPSLLVLTGGHALFRYTTPDGSPIEGHVGFAMGQGAIRVQQPTAQRLDVGTAAAGNRDVGLDTGAALALPLEDQLLLPTRGIPVAPCGTLLLWVPGKSDADDDVRVTRVAAALPVLARLLHDTTDHPQQWLLAVPAGMQDALIAGLQDRLRELRPDGLPVVVHQPDQLQGHDPWLLFVDAAGVLRAVAEVGDARLYSKVQKWARMFRAR